MITVDFTNDKEIDKLFKEMAKDQSFQKPMKKSLKKIIKPIEQDIRSNTPVKTGALRDKVYSDVTEHNGAISGNVGFKFEGKRDKKVSIYGHKWEFGGKITNFPARRMVRNAFDRNRNRIKKQFFDDFLKEFDKVIKKLNKSKTRR